MDLGQKVNLLRLCGLVEDGGVDKIEVLQLAHEMCDETVIQLATRKIQTLQHSANVLFAALNEATSRPPQRPTPPALTVHHSPQPVNQPIKGNGRFGWCKPE